MGGVLGHDMGVILALAEAFEYDARAVADLIGSAQPAIVEKMNQR